MINGDYSKGASMVFLILCIVFSLLLAARVLTAEARTAPSWRWWKYSRENPQYDLRTYWHNRGHVSKVAIVTATFLQIAVLFSAAVSSLWFHSGWLWTLAMTTAGLSTAMFHGRRIIKAVRWSTEVLVG